MRARSRYFSRAIASRATRTGMQSARSRLSQVMQQRETCASVRAQADEGPGGAHRLPGTRARQKCCGASKSTNYSAKQGRRRHRSVRSSWSRSCCSSRRVSTRAQWRRCARTGASTPASTSAAGSTRWRSSCHLRRFGGECRSECARLDALGDWPRASPVHALVFDRTDPASTRRWVQGSVMLHKLARPEAESCRCRCP